MDIENYEKYLEIITPHIDDKFEAQKEYIACKRGCSKCCKTTTVPFTGMIEFENIAENSATYCGKGDIVGVKGRVQSRTVEKEEGKKEYLIEIIAEKITFLSSKKEDKKTDN